MSLRAKQSIKEFHQSYQAEVLTMLLAFGYDRSQANTLINKYQDQIKKWAGNSPNSGSIVTAAMAARMIRRHEAQLRGQFIDL